MMKLAIAGILCLGLNASALAQSSTGTATSGASGGSEGATGEGAIFGTGAGGAVGSEADESDVRTEYPTAKNNAATECLQKDSSKAARQNRRCEDKGGDGPSKNRQ